MCDTLGFVKNGKAVFGKNSDRSPNEPQILQFVPATEHSEAEIKATYITVPQVAETHAVLLSRPTWLWGAEIGVNDCGVCIGNEAVWTLGKYGKTCLTGMDMLRIALERSASAGDALNVLTDMLERYGQGGNSGYDHDFFYDNSFLVMDRNGLYVLETAGREWVWKQYDSASISNRLSIGDDGDRYSGGKRCNFALKHTEHLYNFASGSGARRKQTRCSLSSAESAEDVMKTLRQHNCKVTDPFAEGTVSSTCMHFGGMVGDHTTASMVVDLQDDRTVVWATGSSLPCVSLFKPWIFGSGLNDAMREGEKYWYCQERFRRSLICKKIPEEYFAERDALEIKWGSLIGSQNLDEICFNDEKSFYEKWGKYDFEQASCSSGFSKRWGMKNEVFFNDFVD